MKKLLLFTILALVGFSCSDNDTTPQSTNPELLSKIIFYPGLAIEKHWDFNPDGLLEKITKPDGTVLQTFTYDSNNNLLNISATQFTDSYTFTYDSNNRITSVNGQAVTYNAGENKYSFTYSCTSDDCLSSVVISLNPDRYVTKIIENHTSIDGNYAMQTLSATFNNGNAIDFGWDMTGGSYQYDSHENPLQTALAPLCKAGGLLNFQYNNSMMQWIDGQYLSANNVTYCIFGDGPMDKYDCQYDYNINNLPQVQHYQPYDESGPLGWLVKANYYYQGDIVP